MGAHRYPGDWLRPLLAHPLARRLDPDDPDAPQIHRRVINEKRLLRDVYDEWYRALASRIGAARPVLEIGSGAGYLGEFVPRLITSDVRPTPATGVVLDAQHLPFRTSALGGIAMTNVLHHLPDVQAFFREAARVVRPGGLVAAVEPWVSAWSRFVYGRLHHERFDPEAAEWAFAGRGPLSSANGALPWILFARDRAAFERANPEWRVDDVQPGWPMRYLLSGGVSLRSFAPAAAGPMLAAIDRRLARRADRWAMFAVIVLRRTGAAA